MSHHEIVCRVFGSDWRFRRGFGHSLLLRGVLLRLELVLGSQARLKPHFVGTGPEDGGDAELHLEVQEVVPRVFEEQILSKTKK